MKILLHFILHSSFFVLHCSLFIFVTNNVVDVLDSILSKGASQHTEFYLRWCWTVLRLFGPAIQMDATNAMAHREVLRALIRSISTHERESQHVSDENRFSMLFLASQIQRMHREDAVDDDDNDNVANDDDFDFGASFEVGERDPSKNTVAKLSFFEMAAEEPTDDLLGDSATAAVPVVEKEDESFIVVAGEVGDLGNDGKEVSSSAGLGSSDSKKKRKKGKKISEVEALDCDEGVQGGEGRSSAGAEDGRARVITAEQTGTAVNGESGADVVVDEVESKGNKGPKKKKKKGPIASEPN